MNILVPAVLLSKSHITGAVPMTQPPSRVALFVLAHYLLVIALVVFSLGSLGVAFADSLPASEAWALSIVSGVFFFLSVVSVSVWAYRLAREHGFLPALRSADINE